MTRAEALALCARAIAVRPPDGLALRRAEAFSGSWSGSETAVERELVGDSPVMQRLRADISRAASRDGTVSLRGETGSGKGLVARELHRLGYRRARPFVHVDCASLAPQVIESELFGHERGAFTDAVARRPGRFELASDGTLFLDEIGELPLALQAKLLRVLQDREFERVGGVETLMLRARIIAATNVDLAALSESGRFRRDLFYRLDVLSLEVPPLRERLGDLPALVAHLGRSFGVHEPPTPGALARLAEHDWPGNVRELANVVERVLTFEGRIDRAGVVRALEGRSGHSEVRDAPAAPVADESDSLRARIARELAATGGNVRRTARRLGIPRSTLRYRIQRWSLEHLLPDAGETDASFEPEPPSASGGPAPGAR